MPSTAELQIVFEGKDAVSGTIRKVKGELKGLETTMAGVAKTAGGFLVAQAGIASLDAITGKIGGATRAASDLNESVNAVNQIFGESAQVIQDWGKNNATQFGLSQRAFNQLATPLGAMLQSQGFKDFSGLTIELTKRAADMASVFNTDVGDALGAIQAALRGETDPIEKYGVALSAAKVEARALADSGKASAAALTDQEKAAARVALIFEQTAAVQGDFAATSDEAANKARIAAARNEELAAVIGQKLLPIQLKITEAKLAFGNAMVSRVIPALEALYQKHWPAIAKAIETVRPVVEFFINDVAARIGAFIGAFEAVAEGIKSFIGVFDSLIRGDWSAAWDNLKSVVENGAKLAVNAIVAILGTLPNVMIGIMEKVLNIVIDGWNKVAGVFSGEVKVLGQNINPLAGQDLTQGNVSLPRLPQAEAPFGDISNTLKDLSATTANVDAGMVNLAVNTKDAAAAVQSLSDQISEATSALFGGGTREELELQRKQAQLQRQLLQMPENATGRAGIERQLQGLQRQSELMENQNRIQQLNIQLADQNLLREKEQNQLVGILVERYRSLSGEVEFAETAIGRFAKALGLAATQLTQGPVYDYSGPFPIERRDLTGARI